MKILNYGSCCIDNVYQVEHFVQPGETITSNGFDIFPGGKGLNQSIALANAGASVIHAGKIGKDGRWLRNLLEEKGANVDHLMVIDGPSGHANIQINRDGENAIVIVGGANQLITPNEFEQVFSTMEAGDYLLLQNEVSHLGELMEFGHNKGLRIVFNAAPMTPAVMSLPLDKVEFLIVNETEAAALNANLNSNLSRDPDTLITELLSQLTKTTIVLTLGEHGAIVADQQQRWQSPAFKADVVDTTGAGDTFTGFFLAAVTQGLPMDVCLQQACKAASIAVTRAGAATGIPHINEL